MSVFAAGNADIHANNAFSDYNNLYFTVNDYTLKMSSVEVSVNNCFALLLMISSFLD